MTKKLTAFLILTMVFAFPCMASASNIKISDFDNSDFALVTGNGNNSQPISISVFGKDKTASDAENMVENALIYANQITSYNDDYSFSFPISFVGNETGEYRISIYQNGLKIFDDSVYYANNNDNKSAVIGLNSVLQSGNSTEINSFISDNKINLEFKSPYDKNVSVSEISNLLSAAVPFDENDKKKCAASYKKAMLIGAISTGVITDIKTVESEIDVFNSEAVRNVYASSYVTENAKLSIASKLKSFAPFSSCEEFDERLSEAIALSVVKYPTGAGDVKTVLQALYSSFPTELLSADICRSVAYKDFESLEKMKKVMEGESKATVGSNKTSGGGGSSGGGGGTPFTVSSNTVAPKEDTDANDIIDYFSDTEITPWAVSAINYLTKKGIVAGKEKGKFYPNDNVTREEFVKMLVGMSSLQADEEQSVQFTDVPDNAWYKKYVDIAYGAGIISGRDDGKFGSGENITRQDAAVMLCRYVEMINNSELAEKTDLSFIDSNDISDYAADSVKKIKELGIISGYQDGSFRPHEYMTRAEAATILYKTDKGAQ